MDQPMTYINLEDAIPTNVIATRPCLVCLGCSWLVARCRTERKCKQSTMGIHAKGITCKVSKTLPTTAPEEAKTMNSDGTKAKTAKSMDVATHAVHITGKQKAH